MEKIIHYCWFGGKPLPQLAKRCIKSWKKFLPDYKIIEWNEKNFDINTTEFSKNAYSNKKWAFVADVARVYALKEHGGIYFDTDMLVTKKIDLLLKNDFFVGWESKDFVAVGVVGVKQPNHPLINKLVKIYNDLSFDENNLYSFSMPKILTKLLKSEYNLKDDYPETQKLKNNVAIYARDYFYPLSYDRKENFFTDHTCMIHYYDASWVSKGERRSILFTRLFGAKTGMFILKLLSKIKNTTVSIIRKALFPVLYFRRKSKNKRKTLSQNLVIRNRLEEISGKNLVIYNPKWLGTSNATKELFENTLPIEEVFSARHARKIAEMIFEKNYNVVVFSAFAIGWSNIAKHLKELNKDIVIKTIWHGSNSLHIEEYDWLRFREIFKLYNDKIIDSLGFAKKSMADFYELKGYNTEFIMNTVHLSKEIANDNTKTKYDIRNVKIGLYASGDRWVKNFYNQLSATSLVPNAIVECIPVNDKVYEFAEIIKLNVKGSMKPIPREELLQKMIHNDINVYVTFTECAPLLPLESLELGVPCITGNNHHYWENHELRDYLVVNEADNVVAIYEKILYCLENKEKIMKLYSKWKKDYDIQSKMSVEKFLMERK